MQLEVQYAGTDYRSCLLRHFSSDGRHGCNRYDG